MQKNRSVGVRNKVARNGPIKEKVGIIKNFNIMARKRTEDMGTADKQLEYLKTYIRRVLKQNDKYKPEMTHQVELTASTLLVFRKVRDEVLKADQLPTVTEKSRENEDRTKENPIYNLYIKMADVLRRDLRSLRMNQELDRGSDTESGSDTDAMTKLMESMKDE